MYFYKQRKSTMNYFCKSLLKFKKIFKFVKANLSQKSFWFLFLFWITLAITFALLAHFHKLGNLKRWYDGLTLFFVLSLFSSVVKFLANSSFFSRIGYAFLSVKKNPKTHTYESISYKKYLQTKKKYNTFIDFVTIFISIIFLLTIFFYYFFTL